MKICFFAVTVLEHGGGLENFFIETARTLKNNHSTDIEIVTMDEDFSIRIVNLLSLYNFKRYKRSILQKISKEEISQLLGNVTYRKCRTLNELRTVLSSYDLIYSKNELLEAFILKFYVKYSYLKKIIFGCHTSLRYTRINGFKDIFRNYLYSSFVYKYMVSGVSSFHVLNQYDKIFLTKLFPNKKIFIIPNSFDFLKFQNESSQNYFDLGKTNKIKLLWIGMLHAIKGVDDLVKLVEFFNLKGYEGIISWIIAGDGQDKDKILELEHKFINIKYLGFVPHHYIGNIISQSDIIVSTSRMETFSYITIEANAIGKPVIAYHTAGQSDLIKNDVNGFLVNDLSDYTRQLENMFKFKMNKIGIVDYITRKLDSNVIYNDYLNMFYLVTK